MGRDIVAGDTEAFATRRTIVPYRRDALPQGRGASNGGLSYPTRGMHYRREGR